MKSLWGGAVFALATGRPGKDPGDVNVIGAVAVEVMAQAIVRAAITATGLCGVPAAAEL